jgi:hypothetical protein
MEEKEFLAKILRIEALKSKTGTGWRAAMRSTRSAMTDGAFVTRTIPHLDYFADPVRTQAFLIFDRIP